MCTSRPKPPPAPQVVERQPLKSPVDRASLSSGGDAERRRRMIAGVMTSARGLTEPASTTKRAKMGGDQAVNPIVGGGGAASAPGAPTAGGEGAAPAATLPPFVTPDILARLRNISGGLGYLNLRPNIGFG